MMWPQTGDLGSEKLNRDREIPSAYVLFPVWLSSHGTYVHYFRTNQTKLRSPFGQYPDPYGPENNSEFLKNFSSIIFIRKGGAENKDG